ncbi:MAG TPA: hypothetical protein VMT62_07265 [Syntrophorhabdaceae bacterium]|nr:hypothetical protein [Syntrophorhabdaceae bacterium]
MRAGGKYSAVEKLREKESCPRMELAHCLLTIIDTIVENHEKGEQGRLTGTTS